MVFRDGIVTGGYLSTEHALRIPNRRNCERTVSVYENLWLRDFTEEAVVIEQNNCAHDTDQFHLRFRDVVVGDEERELTEEDFHIVEIPDGALIEVEYDGETAFTLEF